MPELNRVSNWQFQIAIHGFEVAGEAPKRRPLDICLDAIWEDRRLGAVDYGGHPVWDQNQRFLDTIEVSGPLSCAKEVFALPYVREQMRNRPGRSAA